jgi:type II secretory pathway pseudopilin PulG
MWKCAQRSETGFTLVEVMVAIAVLMVGVLGTVSMVDAANQTTSANNQRETATSLAREIVESVRTVPYPTIAGGGLAAAVQGQSGLADDDAAGGWQIERRGTTFTIAVTACAFDDPRDGTGTHGPSFCSDVGAAGTADASADDYSRVKVTVTWSTASGRGTVEQPTLVTSDYRGPRVTAVTPTTTLPLTDGTPTIYSGISQGFSATTAPAASRVEWFVDGKSMGNAAGSGTSWSFGWPLGTACSTTPGTVRDGQYEIGAKGFDSAGQSGGPFYLTVLVNRCTPQAPTGLQGGRNGAGKVELQWDASPEGDIVGYYVYRVVGTATPTTASQISGSSPCAGLLTEPECIDNDPSSSSTLTYNVRAVDKSSSGQERVSPASSNLSVTTNNRPPAVPTLYNASTYATLGWLPTTDPDSGDSVDFYRVYRDGARHDVVDNSGSYLLWDEPEPDGATHEYRITAVDTRLRESALSNAITR